MAETGYRDLIIMRHAKTEQGANSDRARKLTSRGRADASAGGRWLAANGVTPNLILTSPAARALATAELVSAELGNGAQIRTVEDLYGASSSEALEIIADASSDVVSLLVVGHNPTVEELAHELPRDGEEGWAHLPTAALVVLRVAGEWAELGPGTAELVDRHVPRAD